MKPISDADLGFEPFYIGKGSKNRIMDHLKAAAAAKEGRRLSYIRKLVETDSVHIVKIAENLTEDDAFALEIKLIAKFGRRDLKTGCLLNFTPGGEGCHHTTETCKKISDSNRGKTIPLNTRMKISKSLTGRIAAPGVGSKISKSLTGRKRNPKDGMKISKTLTGKKHTSERKKNIVLGMQQSIEKQRKKWLVVTPETSFCIVSLDYLKEAGIGNLYRSFTSGKPLSKGPLKGWQLFQITSNDCILK